MKLTTIFRAGALVAGVGVGCSKSPTMISVYVDADAKVPPVSILRTIVARAADPSQQTATNRESVLPGTDAQPAPYVFPLILSLTVDPSFAGSVVVTVDGVDWSSSAVVATGSASAVVVGGNETGADVTLTATGAGGGGGGGGGAGGGAGGAGGGAL